MAVQGPDGRFPPSHRLKTRGEFDRVFSNPKRSGGKYFTVLAVPGAHSECRLGLIVSRKVDKRAVGRNRVKRLVRESFRTHVWDAHSVDVVVLAKAGAATASSDEVFNELRRHWRRVSRKE